MIRNGAVTQNVPFEEDVPSGTVIRHPPRRIVTTAPSTTHCRFPLSPNVYRQSSSPLQYAATDHTPKDPSTLRQNVCLSDIDTDEGSDGNEDKAVSKPRPLRIVKRGITRVSSHQHIQLLLPTLVESERAEDRQVSNQLPSMVRSGPVRHESLRQEANSEEIRQNSEHRIIAVRQYLPSASASVPRDLEDRQGFPVVTAAWNESQCSIHDAFKSYHIPEGSTKVTMLYWNNALNWIGNNLHSFSLVEPASRQYLNEEKLNDAEVNCRRMSKFWNTKLDGFVKRLQQVLEYLELPELETRQSLHEEHQKWQHAKPTLEEMCSDTTCLSTCFQSMWEFMEKNRCKCQVLDIHHSSRLFEILVDISTFTMEDLEMLLERVWGIIEILQKSRKVEEWLLTYAETSSPRTERHVSRERTLAVAKEEPEEDDKDERHQEKVQKEIQELLNIDNNCGLKRKPAVSCRQGATRERLILRTEGIDRNEIQQLWQEVTDAFSKLMPKARLAFRSIQEPGLLTPVELHSQAAEGFSATMENAQLNIIRESRHDRPLSFVPGLEVINTPLQSPSTVAPATPLATMPMPLFHSRARMRPKTIRGESPVPITILDSGKTQK
ncbi:hypothetical protein EJ05DRAFT_497036 [Pseudovirgaria hyperparasitica]|uniref:Uncharacterized protein n=1 Tax=Pseudovirgaria hyperparasitica TaxID=470096 RepID=A0A6A6WIP4_9PEZI|nr:uncharacterized protein EJ05DRAFT_497036 [Pseudovirgaria hyperparasitica]KAF2762169.1 hypothetical protein EJ05DRAFT_497036 [Pseudovirgaria hyperparasitica]